ncbi:MAG: TIR domain-containing protein [candidate division Zixibacteria bacterium]|nr:TIR domain-containing protein [candidate division Zixibacteria bacterium]
MVADKNHTPANYKGVMVSSTFSDLKEHRAALINAINKNDLKPVVIEYDSAKPDIDVLDSSLQMVHDASAYVGVIGHKYGQIPDCFERNPNRLSLTELEFNEARQLERPVLLFIMGDNHPVTKYDVETDLEKARKLEAYRESAKEGRIYVVFESLEDFTIKAIHAVASLRHHLDEQAKSAAPLQEPLEAFDVFISYNTKDKLIIGELATSLVARGIRPWFDDEQIPPGALFQNEIQKGLDCSATAIVAYGEHELGPWQTEELHALLQKSVYSGKLVIPVLLPGAPNKAKIPVFLSIRNWLDLTDGLTPENIDKLAWGITGKKTSKHLLIPTSEEPVPIPIPPAFYAEPLYIGSHAFVVRKAQFDILNDWAAPADSHPVLLFEAIGGAGKSMLTWEWVTKHATGVRDDWAGRFWYSFYERGAIMADFCRRALAYITGRSLEDFRKKKTTELGELLLYQLQDRPWLLIFDGLERLLVAYQRFDAAQITDELAGEATDQIAHRDPCAAIRPEDDELLRALAGATPSKLLLTSRLIPRILLNTASQPIPGIIHERLPGLRPLDAEALLRACGATGDSNAIQNYLQTHCDCHPLVIGVLAGLVNNYLPDRGNFDAWAADPNGGGQLDLSDLDLVQKRNHILHSALAAIDDKSRQLLSTLAMLSEAVDYPTLRAFNPYPPSEIDSIKKLADTVRDLENRGLIQYDSYSKRYDLHPVVRGITIGRLSRKETEHYGQRVVDHFSQQSRSPNKEAETLDDVRDSIYVVRTLLRMGERRRAYNTYVGDLSQALLFNLEAYAEVLSLLRPFFTQGWATLPSGLNPSDGAYLANCAAIALRNTGENKEALSAYDAALLANLKETNWSKIGVELTNISLILTDESRLAKQERSLLLAQDIAASQEDVSILFRARLFRFRQLFRIGRWAKAEAMWGLLDPMGRDWPRSIYRLGGAERHYAYFRFWQGDMTEEHLAKAERLAKAGKNRKSIRSLNYLRGEWNLQKGLYQLAYENLRKAVRMAREVGKIVEEAEARLALARFHLGQLSDPRHEVERLAKARKPFHRGLAELWLAIGDHNEAKKHALAAYKWAWADGEPYVHRYELNKTIEVLKKLDVPIPNLPDYDPAKDEKLPWEDEVVAAIEKLKAENEAKKAAEENEKK